MSSYERVGESNVSIFIRIFQRYFWPPTRKTYNQWIHQANLLKEVEEQKRASIERRTK